MHKIEEVLLYFSMKYSGDFNSIYKALDMNEMIDQDDFEKTIAHNKASYVTMISDNYPESLKLIRYPPFVLYYYGDLSLLKEKCIGVIGMRVPSEYGQSVTNKLVKNLVKENYTIVSGMALGIDTIAHRSAMNNAGKTVAILGSGIDYCYPKRNKDIYENMKENHLIISEYPGDIVPQKDNFPKRNRIIAGLCSSLLVTEAKERSGTMITVGHALEQGKDIFAVPSGIDGNIGCNTLIQQGAKLVNYVQDVIDE